MNKNLLFKSLLVGQTAALIVYSVVAFNYEGPDLFSVFISNIQSLKWSGQFDLDFSCYLTLSGIWIMWRNRFNSQSIFLGLIAMVFGILFFAPYLLFLLQKEKGDLKKLVVGKQ